MKERLAMVARRHPLRFAISGALLLLLACLAFGNLLPRSDAQEFAAWKARFHVLQPGFAIVAEKRNNDWFLLVGKSEGGETIAACAWYRGDCPRAIAGGEYHYRIQVNEPSSQRSLFLGGEIGTFSAPAFQRHPISGVSQMGEMRIATIEPRYAGSILVKAELVVEQRVQPQPTDLPAETLVARW